MVIIDGCPSKVIYGQLNETRRCRLSMRMGVKSSRHRDSSSDSEYHGSPGNFAGLTLTDGEGGGLATAQYRDEYPVPI